jgi:hypothetical protein
VLKSYKAQDESFVVLLAVEWCVHKRQVNPNDVDKIKCKPQIF